MYFCVPRSLDMQKSSLAFCIYFMKIINETTSQINLYML